jgi:hypothetical protein
MQAATTASSLVGQVSDPAPRCRTPRYGPGHTDAPRSHDHGDFSSFEVLAELGLGDARHVCAVRSTAIASAALGGERACNAVGNDQK